MQRLKGIGVSSGIGAGRAVVLVQRTQVLRFWIPAASVRAELSRLEEARRRSADQLDRIQLRLPGRDLGALFEAQRLMDLLYLDQFGVQLLPTLVIFVSCLPSRAMVKTCALPARVETNARWRPFGANAGLSLLPSPLVN